MWGLSALSGATVLPSHLLQPTYFSFALFSPASSPNCLWLLISKIHPQHRGLLGSGGQLGGRVVHTGRWLIIRDYPKYPRTASLGTRAYLGYFSRWPRWSKPALNLFLPHQSLGSYPFPFAVRHVKVFLSQQSRIHNWTSSVFPGGLSGRFALTQFPSQPTN